MRILCNHRVQGREAVQQIEQENSDSDLESASRLYIYPFFINCNFAFRGVDGKFDDRVHYGFPCQQHD